MRDTVWHGPVKYVQVVDGQPEYRSSYFNLSARDSWQYVHQASFRWQFCRAPFFLLLYTVCLPYEAVVPYKIRACLCFLPLCLSCWTESRTLVHLVINGHAVCLSQYRVALGCRTGMCACPLSFQAACLCALSCDVMEMQKQFNISQWWNT